MFNKFFSLFSYDIGLDLGTANTLVWVKDKGVVIREPSVVAMQKKTKQVVAVGSEAKKMLGKTPPSIVVVRPLQGGVISDFDATAVMISHYINKVHEVGKILPSIFSRPRIVIGIPSAVTEVQRRAVWEAALSAGARQAYLIEEPMAAAIGANLSVFSSDGHMVVDIGGGTTEIAVISLGGIVVSRSLKTAGDDMDKAIVHYVRLRNGLLIGEKAAEEVKKNIGSAYKKTSNIKGIKTKDDIEEKAELKAKEDHPTRRKPALGERVEVLRGRDLETGLPKSVKITETEVREALAPVIRQIIQEISDVIEETPPELTSDILQNGIFLTGGGAKLEGIDHLIVEQTHIPVVVSEDPLSTVVKGTGRVLEDESILHKVKVVGGLN